MADLSAASALSRRMLALNLRARYRTSVLGYLWLLATPVAIASVWIFLHRSGLVFFGDTRVPYPVHVTTGVLLWTAFLRMLNAPLQHLQSSRSILSKIGFPWEALLLSGWGEVLIETVVFLMVILVVYVAFGLSLIPIVTALPIVAVLLLLGAAIGMLLAPLGLLYEDVPRATSVATYLLFFLTPIIYPVPSEMPALVTVLANPVAILLVTAREVMTAAPVSHTVAAIAAGAGAVMLFLASWITFRLSMPHLVSKL